MIKVMCKIVKNLEIIVKRVHQLKVIISQSGKITAVKITIYHRNFKITVVKDMMNE